MTASAEMLPSAVNKALDEMARERAAKIIRDSRTAIIFNAVPEWMRAAEAEAFFGIPANQLRDMAIRGDVIAKKFDPKSKKSATIYKVADIRAAIGKLMDYSEWLAKRPDLKQEGAAQ